MFISEAAARSIVREIKEITGRDINIMDENGVIFASTDPERVGQRHPGACRVLEQRGYTASHLAGGYRLYGSVALDRLASQHAFPCGIELP